MFLNSAKGEVDKFKDYKENSGTQIMFSSQLKSIGKNSTYCANRFRIEEENDGSVHIHYRDIRIHMTKEEYNQVANAMKPIPQESTNGS